MRMPSRSDSSRRSAIPSSLRSLTSSAIRSIKRALFTWKGISVTTMAERPLFSSVSTVARAQREDAAALAVRLADGPLPADEPAGREVGSGDVAHQVLDTEGGVFDQGDERVAHLAEIVRRHVRRHADGDAR